MHQVNYLVLARVDLEGEDAASSEMKRRTCLFSLVVGTADLFTTVVACGLGFWNGLFFAANGTGFCWVAFGLDVFLGGICVRGTSSSSSSSVSSSSPSEI